MTREICFQVGGRVQGVGFRRFVVKEAYRIGGISGWVRNLDDGRVEIRAKGEGEYLERLIDACRRGPFFARVDDLSVLSESSCRLLPEIEDNTFLRL